MPALIDNYSAPAQSHSATSLGDGHRYGIEDWRPSAASIIIVYADQFYLNGRIIRLLKEFGTLQDNWDGEDALAPKAPAVRNAKSIAALLDKHRQAIFHTAPGLNGEIMLDIRSKNKSRSIEIIFYAERSVVALFPEQGIASQQTFNAIELPGLLNWVNQK